MRNARSKKIFEYLIVVLVVLWFIFITRLAIHHQFNVPYVESEIYTTWIDENSPIIIDLRESVELRRTPLNYEPLLHLPFLSIESKLGQIQIPQEQPVLIVCSDGNRARLVASLLHEKGVITYYLKAGLERIP